MCLVGIWVLVPSVNRLVLIEDELGGEVLNGVEEIQEVDGPAPDYNDHHVDHFITPPPCA